MEWHARGELERRDLDYFSLLCMKEIEDEGSIRHQEERSKMSNLER